MNDTIIEKILTALGYFIGIAMMGGVVWFVWAVLNLLLTYLFNLL